MRNPFRQVPKSAENAYEQGISDHENGQYESAVMAFTEAMRLDPQNVDARIRRGISHYANGDFDAAADDLTESIAKDPQSASAYLWRGATRLEQHRLDEALNDYSEAIRLDPADAENFGYRGIAYQWTEEYDAAIKDFTRAIELDPTGVTNYLYRGQAYVQLSEMGAALNDFNFVIQADPSCGDAFRYRGQVHECEDSVEQAIADYSEAIRIDPGDAEAYCDRGDVWAQIDECEKAVADFTEAIRLDPARQAAYTGRAEALQMLRDGNKATGDFEMAYKIASQEAQAMTPRRTLVYSLLQTHFEPVTLDSLTITERRFPGRVRADLQRAIDTLFEQMTVCHFAGVRKQYSHEGINFSELVIQDRNDPALSVPPQYEEIDIGEEQPQRCLKDGLWLLEDDGQRFAVFLEPGHFMHRAFGDVGMRFQVATVNEAAGTQITQKFFRHLERSVQEARSYRGKILSLEQQGHGFSGASTGIKVHKLRTIERDQLILPAATIELLERNVIHFVGRRPELRKLELATKKGLLFYGPPGVGKTHTIHYLAGAMQGMTTLLISAEQVGMLGEYMTLARLLQPSMVVIEDADLIARERTRMESVCEEVLLNKLLNEMDGLNEESDILFILTTNRPETLEAAIASRPGRIDQAIEFPLPDAEGRAKLVRLYARGLNLSEAVVAAIARKTENVSGAFIKELMRRAAQFRFERPGAGDLSLADVDNALEELLFRGGSLNRKLLGGQIDVECE